MTDLDRMLHELAIEGSATAGLSDPEEIRAAGDQRRRQRIGMIVGAVAVVVFAGTAMAGAAVYGLPGDDSRIPVTPAVSPSTTASSSAQPSTPSAGPTSAPPSAQSSTDSSAPSSPSATAETSDPSSAQTTSPSSAQTSPPASGEGPSGGETAPPSGGETSAPSGGQTSAPTEELHALADDPFLEGSFGWPDSYRGLERTGRDGEFRDFCLPAPTDLGAVDTRSAEYAGDGEAAVISGALEFESAAAAAAAVAEIRTLPDTCYASEVDRDTTVHEPRDVAVGNEAYTFAYESVPNENNAGSSTSYFGYGVVRDGNIVVVIEFGAMGLPVQGEPYATWSADRLQQLINKAIR